MIMMDLLQGHILRANQHDYELYWDTSQKRDLILAKGQTGRLKIAEVHTGNTMAPPVFSKFLLHRWDSAADGPSLYETSSWVTFSANEPPTIRVDIKVTSDPACAEGVVVRHCVIDGAGMRVTQ